MCLADERGIEVTSMDIQNLWSYQNWFIYICRLENSKDICPKSYCVLFCFQERDLSVDNKLIIRTIMNWLISK